MVIESKYNLKILAASSEKSSILARNNVNLQTPLKTTVPAPRIQSSAFYSEQSTLRTVFCRTFVV